MFDTLELARAIHMPGEVIEEIREILDHTDFSQIDAIANGWWNPETWMSTLTETKIMLGNDPRGFRILTAQLRFAAQHSYPAYREKGISDDVFFATMGCFSRFVGEHLESYGIYGFDRDWWTPRELSLTEFRLGELEYEKVTHEGHPLVSLHIPSDAVLKRENLQASAELAKAFFACPETYYEYEYIFTHTWLLAPNLKEVLRKGSNILTFQKGFTIVNVDPESRDYMQWVFKNEKLSIDDAPENTSLQRNLKAYIKAGNKLGVALGQLTDPTFGGK